MAQTFSPENAETIDVGEKPLVVCDVDEVILHFIAPFKAFLKANGHELRLASFSLNGNIFSLADGARVANETVGNLLSAFYDAQEQWQRPFAGAHETLHGLLPVADVLLLTAMPPRHRESRRRLLSRYGFDFPLIASESPKGEVLQKLCRVNPPTVIFIDDMLYNCRSVAEHMPDALAINMLIDDDYRALAPRTEPPAVVATGWKHAETLIRRHIDESS